MHLLNDAFKIFLQQFQTHLAEFAMGDYSFLFLPFVKPKTAPAFKGLVAQQIVTNISPVKARHEISLAILMPNRVIRQSSHFFDC